MATIRVLYRLRFPGGEQKKMEEAWEGVVMAHRRAGHRALESLFLLAHESERELGEEICEALAISRWASFEDWSEQRRDEVDPDAYQRFRDLCEVVEKEVLVETARIGPCEYPGEELDSLTAIQEFFGVDEDLAGRILILAEWVDAEEAVAIHGYARDNRIPEPMMERLKRPAYREALRAAAADQDEALCKQLR